MWLGSMVTWYNIIAWWVIYTAMVISMSGNVLGENFYLIFQKDNEGAIVDITASVQSFSLSNLVLP